MNTQATVNISAPADRVWAVFTDVQQWPSWTSSVTSVEALDGPAIEVGHRFRIKQPRLPGLIWQVTEVDAPRSWTWVVRSSGATTSAKHEISPQRASECVATQTIEHRGVFGVLAGFLTRRLTRRYLSLEGNGLKTVSEKAHPVAAQP
jgi:uncharacterized protein YndB with AHSA1/START domain